MSRILAAAALLMAACAAPSGPPPGPALALPAAPALRNPGFEDAAVQERCLPGWQCSAHVDVDSFRFARGATGASGQGSLCIERVGKEPWALATQAIPPAALKGRRLRLSMAVRAQSLEGGAGPWIQSQGGRAHAMQLVKSTQGWERVSVELAVPADSNLLAVGATLEGPGRACFDDVRLEVLG